MARIEIVSASAGSGKTYRLSSILENAVVEEGVRPEAVIATTFTNKAAAELQERVASRLHAAGRVDEAHRLGAARIGTVHSVCGRLLAEFSFELGLRPQLRVLDEARARAALASALSDVVQPQELRRLAELEFLMPSFKWREAVARLMDLARTNGISAADLAHAASRSIEEVFALLGPPEDARRPDGDRPGNDREGGGGVEGGIAGADRAGRDLDASLAAALRLFVQQVDGGIDKTKDTTKALALCKDALVRLESGRQIPWGDWMKFANLKVGARSRESAVAVREAGSAHDRHPQLRRDLADAIRLAFSLAARALDAYDAFKRAWGTVDFVDQEVMALEALKNPVIRQRLEGEIDLVLVDEFQDTSPLQLAIFLELASLARRSVWVGDQKQSIYGFRGTDPALMDAAIEAILGGSEPETLDRSWRSRPELVRLTSDLFAPAFARHGLPERRVRLEPAVASEPADLGPVVERWLLHGSNKADRHSELAAMVQQLLADTTVRVRSDAKTSRALRPGDVAILCCRNETCTAVAQALAARGIRAVLPRPGLLSTHEGQAALAALRLWIDPEDALARAQLAQITTWAGRPDEWLERVVAAPKAQAFADLPAVRAIAERRQEMALAGALASFDAALDAAGIRELCLQWGDAETRLANLDALRALAASWEARTAEEGSASTVAGLIAELEARAKAGLDEQAVFASEDAIVLSTWHRAKGLEWPVTILFELEGMREDDGLGVRVACDRPFDLQAPLQGRWIRFWFSPYHPNQRNTPFHQRLREHPARNEIGGQDERQRLRLFYVGWTRARDRLILAGQEGELTDGMPGLLRDEKGPLLVEPTDGRASWAGRTVEVTVRRAEPLAPLGTTPEPGEGYLPPGPRPHPHAFLRPSALEATGTVGEPFTIGSRKPLSGDPDMNALGEAIHAYLSASRSELDGAERERLAADALRRWGVAAAMQPADLVAIGAALDAWIEARWPRAVARREWPVLHRRADGTVVRGAIDLLLETDEGIVVIDHKSFPGDREAALRRAASHAGQLAAYAAAASRAMGRQVVGTFVHLAVTGLVVPVFVAPAAGA